MKKLRLISITGVFLTLIGCGKSSISKPEDYQFIFDVNHVKQLEPQARAYMNWLEKDSLSEQELSKFVGVTENLYRVSYDSLLVQRAIGKFEPMLSNDSLQNADVFRHLGKLHFLLGKQKIAYRLADDALSLLKNYDSTAYLLIEVHKALGNYDESDYFVRAKQDEDYYRYHLLKGNLYWRNSFDYYKALAEYQKALRAAEKHSPKAESEALLKLAQLKFYRGHLQESYEFLIQALTKSPLHRKAAVFLSEFIYRVDENPQEALKIIDFLETQTQRKYFILKATYSKAAQVTEAVDWNRLESIANHSVLDEFYRLEHLYYLIDYKKDFEQAEKLILEEIKDYKDFEHLLIAAVAFDALGKSEYAIEILDKKIVPMMQYSPKLLYALKIYKANQADEKVKKIYQHLNEHRHLLSADEEHLLDTYK
ncbi:MAG: hypothetical protein RQ756_02615 [Flavobacteriaceae bacterium]|nr:hypothetical protein [Flavobacteriaceae bacterium]